MSYDVQTIVRLLGAFLDLAEELDRAAARTDGGRTDGLREAADAIRAKVAEEMP